MTAIDLLPQEIIRRKRDAGALSEAQIRAFIEGVRDGGVGDAQVAAFAMATLLRGMTPAETVALTLAMRDGGDVLAWDDLPGPTVDKHSTGGVGDKVSLVLAPLLAACGAYVPMLSGRGLGHTGGTLDKLESIPDYDSAPGLERLRRAVREAGCAVVGASADLAPADARLYAIRDVTATVESIPFITASILSKKLAGGAGALVMDVKVGSGAFMPTREEAERLARSIVEVARGAGLPCVALLTDMDFPLGRTVGNALEVDEALDVLRGGPAEPRLLAVTLALAAEALVLAGLASDREEARARAERALADGGAAERFASMVRALGGPGDVLERPADRLPRAPVVVPVEARRDGVVAAVDARRLGMAVVALGGGRRRPGDPIDHAVGLADLACPGESVGLGRPLAMVHARGAEGAAAAADAVADAFTLLASGPSAEDPVRGRVG